MTFPPKAAERALQHIDLAIRALDYAEKEIPETHRLGVRLCNANIDLWMIKCDLMADAGLDGPGSATEALSRLQMAVISLSAAKTPEAAMEDLYRAADGLIGPKVEPQAR